MGIEIINQHLVANLESWLETGIKISLEKLPVMPNYKETRGDIIYSGLIIANK